MKEQEKQGTPPRPRPVSQEEEEIKRMKLQKGEALLVLQQLIKRWSSHETAPKSAEESAELSARIKEQRKIIRELDNKSRELEEQLVESQVQNIKSTPPKTPDSKGKGKGKEVAESFQDLQEKAERGESSSQKKRKAKKQAEAIRFKELMDKMNAAITETQEEKKAANESNVKDVSKNLGPGTDESGVPVDKLVLDDEAESSSRRGRSRVRRNEDDHYGREGEREVSPSKKVELDQGQQLVLFDNFDQGSPTKRTRDEDQDQEDQLRLEGSPEKRRTKSPVKKLRNEPLPDVEETEEEINERLDREQRERDQREAEKYLEYDQDQDRAEEFLRDQERLEERRRREQQEEQQQGEGEEGEDEEEEEDDEWQQVDRDDDDREEGEIEQNNVIKENDDGRRIQDEENDEEEDTRDEDAREEDTREEDTRDEDTIEDAPVEGAPPPPQEEPAAGFLGAEPVNQEDKGDIGTGTERMAGGGGGIGNEGGIHININNGGPAGGGGGEGSGQPAAAIVGEGGDQPAAFVGEGGDEMDPGEEIEIQQMLARKAKHFEDEESRMIRERQGKYFEDEESRMVRERLAAGPSRILQELTQDLPDQSQAQMDLANTALGLAQFEAMIVERQKIEQEQDDLRKQIAQTAEEHANRLRIIEKGKNTDLGRITNLEEDLQSAKKIGKQNQLNVQVTTQQLEHLYQRTEESKRELDERLTFNFNQVSDAQKRLAEQFATYGLRPLEQSLAETTRVQTNMNNFLLKGGLDEAIRNHLKPIQATNQDQEGFLKELDERTRQQTIVVATLEDGLERLRENQQEIIVTLGLIQAQVQGQRSPVTSPVTSRSSSPTLGATTFGQPNLVSTPSPLLSLGGGPPQGPSSFFGGGTPYPEPINFGGGGGGGVFAPELGATTRMATGVGNPLAGDRAPGVNPPGGFLQEAPPVDDGLNGQLGKSGLVFLQQIKNTSKNTGTENNEKIGKTLDKLLKVFQPIVNRRKPFKTVEELMKEWKLKLKGTKKLSKALKDTKKKKKVRKLLKKIQGKK